MILRMGFRSSIKTVKFRSSPLVLIFHFTSLYFRYIIILFTDYIYFLTCWRNHWCLFQTSIWSHKLLPNLQCSPDYCPQCLWRSWCLNHWTLRLRLTPTHNLEREEHKRENRLSGKWICYLFLETYKYGFCSVNYSFNVKMLCLTLVCSYVLV